MCSLQGYYGLTQSNNTRSPEGTEMSVFKSEKTLMFGDDAHFLESQTPANGFSPENGDLSENFAEPDGSIRRRRKSDADPSSHTPEILMKEEGAAMGVFSGRAGKGLALRPMLGSRTDLDDCRPNSNSSSGGDSVAGDVALSVRKSSSASSLSEPEAISSIWPRSKWSLKPDVIARPIFDGFQRPLAAWRNKAALGAGSVRGGTDKVEYLKLSVTLLAGFCRVPEIASSQEMLSEIPIITEIISNSFWVTRACCKTSAAYFQYDTF